MTPPTQTATDEPLQVPTTCDQLPAGTTFAGDVTTLAEDPVVTLSRTRPLDISTSWYCEPFRITAMTFDPVGSRLGFTHASSVSAPAGARLLECGT